ncbi:diguanylate cyclase [Alkalilimnicola ehrlichii]|uniref:diguanylate cyclase n=1 Tax=Alkalilimnicola ehrlichii TaxID=351052 RepID=UPI003B9EC4FE
MEQADRNQLNEAVNQAFLRYLDTWLRKRDAAALHDLNGPLVHGFGTGANESVYDPDEAREVIERDISQVPEPFEYAVRTAKVTPLCTDVALVAADIGIRNTILAQGQELALDHLRLTLVFRYIDGAWRLEHLHGSFPATEPDGEEAWPLQALEDRAAVLQRKVWERYRAQEAARQCEEGQASTDALTGLPNRERMDELLHREVAGLNGQSGALAVILIDIDHLNLVNEGLGQEAGDRVLADVANILRDRIRVTDALARWGGGAFLSACPMTDGLEAEYLARALRRAVAETDFGLGFPLTASFGVTALQAGDTVPGLIRRAERGLRQAKEAGRDTVQVVCREEIVPG